MGRGGKSEGLFKKLKNACAQGMTATQGDVCYHAKDGPHLPAPRRRGRNLRTSAACRLGFCAPSWPDQRLLGLRGLKDYLRIGEKVQIMRPQP